MLVKSSYNSIIGPSLLHMCIVHPNYICGYLKPRALLDKIGKADRQNEEGKLTDKMKKASWQTKWTRNFLPSPGAAKKACTIGGLKRRSRAGATAWSLDEGNKGLSAGLVPPGREKGHPEIIFSRWVLSLSSCIHRSAHTQTTPSWSINKIIRKKAAYTGTQY